MKKSVEFRPRSKRAPPRFRIFLGHATSPAELKILYARRDLCKRLALRGEWDALRALKISVGLVVPTPQERIAADVHPDNEPDPDGDGDVDVLDALRILKASVGLVDITSCGGPR